MRAQHLGIAYFMGIPGIFEAFPQTVGIAIFNFPYIWYYRRASMCSWQSGQRLSKYDNHYWMVDEFDK